MNGLSKQDAENLGVADMTGPQLRMRVLQLEGLVGELHSVLTEVFSCFVDENIDRLSDLGEMCVKRAREVMTTVRDRYDEPQYDVHTVQLSKRELDVAREALAAEATITEWTDADRLTIESVISKMEALGARGSMTAGEEAKKMLDMFETCDKALIASVSLIREHAKKNGYEDGQIERFLDRLWIYAKEESVNHDAQS